MSMMNSHLTDDGFMGIAVTMVTKLVNLLSSRRHNIILDGIKYPSGISLVRAVANPGVDDLHTMMQ